MKVVMINDCAFVAATLLKFLPDDMKKQHVKRSRGWWSKTMGIAWEILRARGDVYHVHYLLQDCYIASRLGKKPLVGHAHGSDLRSALKHPLWSRIVRHNLKKCDKIFVSTPEVLPMAREFREDAEYLPNPVDTRIFHSKPTLVRNKKLRVLIASESNWEVKGTDKAIRALSTIKDEVVVSLIRFGPDFGKTLALASSLGLQLNVLSKVPHEKINEYYWDAHVVLDQFVGGALGMITLEAIACGRPVVTHCSTELSEYDDFPMKEVNTPEKIAQTIKDLPTGTREREYQYVLEHHEPLRVVKRLLDAYNQLLEK